MFDRPTSAGRLLYELLMRWRLTETASEQTQQQRAPSVGALFQWVNPRKRCSARRRVIGPCIQKRPPTMNPRPTRNGHANAVRFSAAVMLLLTAALLFALPPQARATNTPTYYIDRSAPRGSVIMTIACNKTGIKRCYRQCEARYHSARWDKVRIIKRDYMAACRNTCRAVHGCATGY